MSLTAADYEEVLKDHRRLVRELDAIFNDGKAAKQASLCDLLPQARQIMGYLHHAMAMVTPDEDCDECREIRRFLYGE